MAMNDTILKLISVFWTDLFQELKGRSQSKSFIKLMMRFKLINCVLGLYFIRFFIHFGPLTPKIHYLVKIDTQD
jgi:hypothetical protein